MLVYCTSKNTGPSYQSDPVHMLYLGTSIKEAEAAVGDFVKYQKDETGFPVNYPEHYSAIPRKMEREMLQFFMADGWWYSIVMINIE
jgi:hypothetical protein